MAYKYLFLALAVLIVPIILLSGASANIPVPQDCYLATACLEGDVPIARASANFNAHAAPLSYTHFGTFLCCDANIANTFGVDPKNRTFC